MRERTKATQIPTRVKIAVANRDEIMNFPACVLCKRHAPMENPYAWSNAHFISRAAGGLGIEKNIVTLCPECHRLYDHSSHRQELRRKIRDYLMSKYPGEWSASDLYYVKGE